LIGLVIDYSLHLLLALEEFDGDLRQVCDHLAAPVTLTALTAMVGFSAPMLSGLPVLSNFGFVMDLGTLSAVTAALVLLPACYVTMRSKQQPQVGAISPGPRPERYPFFHRSWTYQLASRCAAVVPRWFIQGFARGMAWFYLRGRPPVVRVVAGNLALLLGRAPADDEVARTFTSFAVSLADYYHVGARSKAEALALVDERLGFDHMKAAYEAGRGALLLTAHFGLFELGGVVMQDIGFPIVALTLPEASAGLSAWRAAYRRRWGVETVEVGGEDQFSFLEIQRHLAAGKFVAALIDRPHGGQTSVVRFPHGTARCATGILLIALAQRCPIVPVTVTRRADLKYRVEAFEPFYIERRGTTEETLAHYAQRLADVFMPVILRHPEQWYQFVPVSADAFQRGSPQPASSPPSPAAVT
jgi:lauroyl/myristoyl acyltransferase